MKKCYCEKIMDSVTRFPDFLYLDFRTKIVLFCFNWKCNINIRRLLFIFLIHINCLCLALLGFLD